MPAWLLHDDGLVLAQGGHCPRVQVQTAGGLTNRAVAAALLISPKTVEANLARIYQKFEIRSRAELGRRMVAVPIHAETGGAVLTS